MGRDKGNEGMAALGRRVASWRTHRTKQGAMPSELWDAAVALAQRHGVGGVARGAGLDYGSLKRRVDEAEQAEPPEFVELAGAEVFGRSTGAVVEFVEGAAKLTVRLEAGASVDVDALVRSVRGCAR